MAIPDQTVLENLKKAAAQLPKADLPANVKNDLMKAMKSVLVDLDDSIKTGGKLTKDIAALKTKKKELETAQKELQSTIGTFKNELPKKREHYREALEIANDARSSGKTDPAVSLIWSNLQAAMNNNNALPEQLTTDG